MPRSSALLSGLSITCTCIGCALLGQYEFDGQTPSAPGTGATGGSGAAGGTGAIGGTVPTGGASATGGASGGSGGCNPVKPDVPAPGFEPCLGECTPSYPSPGDATCGPGGLIDKDGFCEPHQCKPGLVCDSYDQCELPCYSDVDCPVGDGCDKSQPLGYAALAQVWECRPCNALATNSACGECCGASYTTGSSELENAVKVCVCEGVCSSACASWCSTKQNDSTCSTCYTSATAQTCMTQQCASQACHDYRSCREGCPPP